MSERGRFWRRKGLNTLTNLRPAPESNITVLWSKNFPDNFNRYCIRISKDRKSRRDDLVNAATASPIQDTLP
jgi:pyruvate-formate lyase